MGQGADRASRIFAVHCPGEAQVWPCGRPKSESGKSGGWKGPPVPAGERGGHQGSVGAFQAIAGSQNGGCMMKKLLSCEFNMDTACVELRYIDGTMISIDVVGVENEVAENLYQKSELDYLIYNDPLGYADLILNGDPVRYLNEVTDYSPLD